MRGSNGAKGIEILEELRKYQGWIAEIVSDVRELAPDMTPENRTELARVLRELGDTRSEILQILDSIEESDD